MTPRRDRVAEGGDGDKGERTPPRGRADRGGVAYAYKALRDEAIIEGWLNERSTKELAADFGITRRSVERIVKAGTESLTALDVVPMELVKRVLRSYEREMESWMRVAASTVETQPAVTVAALKGHADARERWLAVVRAIQKLPSRLEIFRYESDIARLGHAMVDALARFEAGEIERDDLMRVVREALQPQLPTVEGTESGG